MLKHQPKTLAKTLDFLIRHSPGEHGLFWDKDGTMPWKDFYWCLQQDPSLRFVREASIREMMLIGIELPFVLDGNHLRLRSEFGPVVYRAASNIPKRLFGGIKHNNLVNVQKIGLRPTRRAYLPLTGDRDFAVRLAARNQQESIVLDITAPEAVADGVSILDAGGNLYLAEYIPVEFIIFPKLRQEVADKLAQPHRKPKVQPSPPPTPGSFILEPRHMEAPGTAKSPGKGTGRSAKSGWKKDSRKQRHKRDI
jgi:putative RNA 2'-phosphotransferase